MVDATPFAAGDPQGWNSWQYSQQGIPKGLGRESLGMDRMEDGPLDSMNLSY
jgi:hypothetical protein